MQKLLLLLLFIFTVSLANAAPITLDGEKSLSLGDKVYILEDTGENLTISDVSSGALSGKFVRSEQKILQFASPTAVYWLRFELQNPNKANLLLEVPQAVLPHVDLFYKDNTGKWQELNAGHAVSLQDKPIQHHYQLFPLRNADGDVYLRIKSKGVPVPITLWNNDAYQVKSTHQKLIYGVYAGILLFVILNNLFLFFTLRKVAYLVYSLLVFQFLQFTAIFDGFLLYLIPNADLWAGYTLNTTINAPVSILNCLVFLEIRKYSPRLFKVVVGYFIYLVSLLAFYKILPSEAVIPLNQFNTLINFVVMLYAGIAIGRKGNKLGYFYALTYAIFFVFATTEIIYIQTGSPEYLFELSYIDIGIFVEAFMLAYLLSLRFKWEQQTIQQAKYEAQEQLIDKTRENEKLIREQNTMLEQNVKARTMELEQTLQELKSTQVQLIQSEKMASLGILTAGVAHEINNPINFITGGIASLRQDYDDVRQYVKDVVKLEEEQDGEEIKTKIKELKVKHQVMEVAQEMEELFTSVNNGAQRVAEIVKNLRSFSRLDDNDMRPANLHEGIDETLLILNSKFADRVTITKQYGKLPLVMCYPGLINQVFMNILSNAADAIDGKGEITIKTEAQGDEVAISISDTGIGMSEETKKKLFDPFYTTKEVGKGTGLGLSIVYSIIEKHSGKIEVESEVGKGTEFIIRLHI